MERRLHERYPANLDAVISDIAVPSRTAHGKIVDISETGVRAEAPLELAVGALVKLQIADSTLFGHVIHTRCVQQNYQIGIEVVRVLFGESDLGRLLNAVLAEGMPHTPGVFTH
jgi:hypothetical protein